ncbi:glycosyltransferase family 39 protein [Mycolicibacterium aichiense]|uniref:Membrane protein n=1 Tax=Mycolicibacterium aichiense TaxID=1799 RepID=A0AAD1HN06_9MYCO|nr:glycosyltransferase family 39 protein [Mycolicibacterium aichiense]MCV7019075.1 glycosyltransferase family 39 protein [Mycolicibacterium aichiense]BBX08377.1 membrane protein [Mycolicibacterium aichiense]STZ82177.1 transmembrane protein [Mycolicibacterium aichiense]
MSITLRPERVLDDEQRRGAPARPRDAVWVAVFATALSAAGAARPSLWFDEAATISASTRPIPDLWRMLGNIDAVHGFYYLLMHGWFAVFPATEFWSRLSSAVAVGVAAAGVVVLGRLLSTRSVAVTAGLVFAILPRVTWAGMEARSYALTMVAGVWLTVLCVIALRRNRPRWWAGYAVAAIAATLLNVFTILLLPVHAVMVATMAQSRSARWRWVLAAAAVCAAACPFLIFTQSQLFQVGWISPLSGRTTGMILVDQYFDRSLSVAVLCALLGLAGLVSWRRAGWRPRRLVVIALAWIVLPTVAVLGYSVLREPVYYPRYLSFTAPAMALLLGLCIVALGRRSRAWITALLVVFAVAATPNYLAQRGPYSKEGMDYSQVADVIARYAAPGDCLVMDNSTAWKPGPIRPLIAARPAAFAKLRDYGRGPTGIQRNMLWDAHIAVWMWADEMPGCPAIWTVSEYDKSLPRHEQGPALHAGPRLGRAMAYQVPYRFGFRIVERWQFNFAQVTKSIR